ncbi:MAG: DUF3516 domain-containing protein [Deltaproteobacteria bacterium]|jgi:hypothetical protein|nr:DUF3516 domain-containing protein [Deltaproteobacteria bacterium]MBW2535587.1 DUF3516 domain-containing protein [Deltaproteobacteria bacterium]
MSPLDDPPLASRLPAEGTDADEVFDRFLDFVTELGIELYPAQEEAILELLSGHNVILNTPTGSGKSLVATALHFKALAEGRRTFYTTPIKALANEKFFDLCREFGPDNVALLTGDAAVNHDAPIVCCTAEILANMALREGEDAAVDYAVLDEFHYYADRDRGVAWQIPLLALPQTTFLLMSATLGDVSFFEKALTDLNGHPTAVVRSTHRPVPLDFSYSELPLHNTVARLIETELAPIYLVNFTQRACHQEAQNLMSINVCSKEDKRAIGAALAGYRFDTPYAKDVQRFARHGIGIHHGGLLPKYRRLVERLAQRGHLKVISGTDTLGVGVNVPIRTVVLTRLCKFDGEKTKILSVREFLQICGRAGRKGYDDRGSVVVQAPPHVAENLKLEQKAQGESGKKKKIVRKKPPTKGYVHWDRGTFDKLRTGTPEPLESRFAVSHALLVNVLSRPEDGCAAVKRLIRSCHDRPALQRIHGRTALSMFRALLDANIVELVDDEGGRKRVEINADLQRDFSLNYTLSLYVVDTLRLLDPERPSYATDVLSLVEAILENPTILLLRQLDRIKRERLAELKAEGVEYEDRIAELDAIEHPKPNRDFIYGTFNEFAAKHPWIGPENIRPKGFARELFDHYLGFNEAVRDFGLERAEGTLLRYLTEVYKALVQNVPEWARTDEVDDLIGYFHDTIYGVDASLLDEWEKLRDPDYEPAPPTPQEQEPERPPSITDDVRTFTVLVRNHVFSIVRSLAQRDYEAAAALVEPPPDEPPWTGDRFAAILAPYYEDHETIRFDSRARGTEHTILDRSSDTAWTVIQKLVDPDEHNDWMLDLTVDLERSRQAAAPVLILHKLGP